MNLLRNHLKKIDIDKIDKRSFNVIKNIALSVGIKGFSIVIALLTLPVYVKYFSDKSILGIWLTLISTLGWIFTFDLGIGNGLRNKLVKLLAEKNYKVAKRYISSAYFGSMFLSILLITIIFIVISQLNLVYLFNIEKSIISNATLKISISVLLIGIILQFTLKIINSILLSMQKAALPSTLTLFSNLLLLIYMLLVNPTTISKDFIYISIIYVITTNIPLLIATIFIFKHELKDVSPSLEFFDMGTALDTIKLGSSFLWLQIMAMLIINTNMFLITILINPSEVIGYQIYDKLFGLVSMLFTIGLTPIWSAVTDALAKRDFNWIIKTRRRIFKFLLLALVAQFAMCISSKKIIEIWMGKQYITIGYSFPISVAIFHILNIWSGINANIANGLGKLKNQMIFLTIGALINIPLAYLFVKINQTWVMIVLANIVSLLPFCITETISTSRYLKKGN